MHGVITPPSLSIAIVSAAIQELQPRLAVSSEEHTTFLVEGSFELSGSDGPFDYYSIRMVIPKKFPTNEPDVFEIGGRIPHKPERHINIDGSCCLTVWEEWLAIANDLSFRGFLDGPVKEFFLNQWWFEKKGKWRFGERSHGTQGLIEAYASVLGTSPNRDEVLDYLRLLSEPWPKGHWACSCGSDRKFKHCHRPSMIKVHQRLPPHLAKRMARRLIGSLL